MIDYKPDFVKLLQPIGLPVLYELFANDKTPIPCLTYSERYNNILTAGDTIDYSNISFRVKLWGNSLEELAKYKEALDRTLKSAGFTRANYNELSVGSQIVEIFDYTAIGYENLNIKE